MFTLKLKFQTSSHDNIKTNFDKIAEKLTLNSRPINSDEYVKITQDGLNAAIEFQEIISKVNYA